jgi:hypothetical protein
MLFVGHIQTTGSGVIRREKAFYRVYYLATDWTAGIS